MHQPTVTIQSAAAGLLRLSKAILIYAGNGQTHASIHDVAEVDGAPTILAGKPAGTRATRALARQMNPRAPVGFLPDNVLTLGAESMVWWVRPGVRHLSFRAPELGADQRSGSADLPGLVFAAGPNIWSVWALRQRGRPTPKTRLYHCPFLNVWPDGKICRGTVQLPPGAAVDQMAQWDSAFFRTFFTHPNSGALIRYPLGHFAFWRDWLDGKFARFPTQVLAPTKHRLSDLLSEVNHA